MYTIGRNFFKAANDDGSLWQHFDSVHPAWFEMQTPVATRARGQHGNKQVCERFAMLTVANSTKC